MKEDRSAIQVETLPLERVRDKLNEMHKQINKKISYLNELNKQNKEKQELSFLKTFANVMDKMSAELLLAQEKYKNIDKEIERDDKCQRFEKQVHFFRQQCLVLTQQLNKKKDQVRQLKVINQILMQEKQTLHATILKKTQQRYFLLQKIKELKSDESSFKQTKSNMFMTQKNITKRDTKEQSEALSGLINNLKSNSPKLGVGLLKQFLSRQANFKAPYRSYSVKNQIRDSERKNQVNLQLKKNQLLELWEQCVRQSKAKEKVPKFLAKQSKYKILENFFASEKFIQIIKRLLFDQKCCNNWNCINNFSEFYQAGIQSKQKEAQSRRTSRQYRKPRLFFKHIFQDINGHQILKST